MSNPIASIVATLHPNTLISFCKRPKSTDSPASKAAALFSNYYNGALLEDPAPMPYAPFVKKSPDDKPKIDDKDKYKYDFFPDGTVKVTKAGISIKNAITERFQAARHFPIDYEYLKDTKNHPLIVDPYAATLAVYDPNIGFKEKVETSHFRDKTNLKIIEYLASGGVTNPATRNLLGQAVMMDTASRTPEIMSPEFIQHGIKWYAQNANGGSFWIGTGSEHYSLNPNDRAGALATGKANINTYTDLRILQLELVQTYGQTPILFPDVMHMGLDDTTNAKIIKEILKGKEGEVVLHKLGTPFNPNTDWFTLDLLKEIAGLGKAVKTSTPVFGEQLKDYDAIMAGKGAMYTGDDRNFAFVWLWAAIQQLKENKTSPPTHERNGFHFIKDKNMNALLGYVGLNPKQTIAGIIELSKWYHEKNKGTDCDNEIADQHLNNYLEIMMPAMGMSIDAFFSDKNHTPSYTDYVWASHRFAGVINQDDDGRVLPHRRSLHDGTENQKLINSRFLVWQFLAGTIPPEQIAEAIGNNTDILEIA